MRSFCRVADCVSGRRHAGFDGLPPLIIFLALYNYDGILSVMPILYNSKARMFIIISVYMATNAVFFR